MTDDEILSPADVLDASNRITFYAGKVAGAAEIGDVTAMRDAVFHLAILVGAMARYVLRNEPQP